MIAYLEVGAGLAVVIAVIAAAAVLFLLDRASND